MASSASGKYKSIREFTKVQPLGRGAFGTAWLCTRRDDAIDGAKYAVKAVKLSNIFDKKSEKLKEIC